MMPPSDAAPICDMTPAEFDERRQKGELWQLVDVREAWELERASLPGAIHIPMAEITERHGELDRERPVAVVCHSGVRSARVVAYLRQIGFAAVANIEGGIDAWSTDLDASVPRY